MVETPICLSSAVRVSVACAAHYVILWLGVGAAKAYQPPTRRVLLRTALNGVVGMWVWGWV